MAPAKFVSYVRVSTQRQGASGLGLDAQRKAVADYLNGRAGELVEEFTEVESGRRNDRPQLAAALVACRKHRATLLIAKLDRLARNVAFVANLMESGVEFVAVDMPMANRLTVHILAAVAEHERDAISARTKAALAAAKARGRHLGWSIEERREEQLKASRRGADSGRSRADAFAANVAPVVESIRASGISTLAGIADALNARGVRTARGGMWHPTTVRNVVRRSGSGARK